MSQNAWGLQLARRQFLSSLVPAGALACLGCSPLLAMFQTEEKTGPLSQKHEFAEDTHLTLREAFQVSIQASYVPIMKYFAAKFGREQFAGMLKEGYTDLYSSIMKKVAERYPEKNLSAFREAFGKASLEIAPTIDPDILGNLMERAYTAQLLEVGDKVRELKVTECLYAETYREVDAAGIGYYTHCYPDFVLAEAFDPRMKLFRTRTLMEGDDCCNHRYVWEG